MLLLTIYKYEATLHFRRHYKLFW